MLTLLERLQQKSLKANMACLYPISYITPKSGGKDQTFHTSVYAINEEDARSLAIKLQSRAEEKQKADGPLAQWGLDLSEIKSNKLGLILPWRDPVNKRSITNGIRLPALRALVTMKSIKHYAQSHNIIEQSDLCREQINHYLSKTIISGFTTFTLLVIGCYLLFLGLISDEGIISKFGFSALFVFIHCATTIFKTLLARKMLLSWRERLDE